MAIAELAIDLWNFDINKEILGIFDEETNESSEEEEEEVDMTVSIFSEKKQENPVEETSLDKIEEKGNKEKENTTETKPEENMLLDTNANDGFDDEETTKETEKNKSEEEVKEEDLLNEFKEAPLNQDIKDVISQISSKEKNRNIHKEREPKKKTLSRFRSNREEEQINNILNIVNGNWRGKNQKKPVKNFI